MSPETVTAVWGAVGIIGGAAVTAGPLYLQARRTRRTAQEEGEATRDAVSSAMDSAATRLEGRIDGFIDEVRNDLREIREWQASHTAEHVLLDHNRRNPPPSE